MIQRMTIICAFVFGVLATPVMASDDIVACVQKGLNALGFDAGTVDGLFGNTTTKAAAAYQASELASENAWAQSALSKQNTEDWCVGLTIDHSDALSRYDIADGEYRGLLAGKCMIVEFNGEVRRTRLYESCFGDLKPLGDFRSVVQDGGVLNIDQATFEFEKTGDNLSGRWTLGDYTQLLVLRKQ